MFELSFASQSFQYTKQIVKAYFYLC